MLNSVRFSGGSPGVWEQAATNRVEAKSAALVALPIRLSTILSPFAAQHRYKFPACPRQILPFLYFVITKAILGCDRLGQTARLQGAGGVGSRITRVISKRHFVKGCAVSQGDCDGWSAKNGGFLQCSTSFFIHTAPKIITLDAKCNIGSVSGVGHEGDDDNLIRAEIDRHHVAAGRNGVFLLNICTNAARSGNANSKNFCCNSVAICRKWP